MYALNLDKETGRILSATFEKYAVEGMPIVKTLPEGDIFDYIYLSGEYVYDPLSEPVIPEIEATTDEA